MTAVNPPSSQSGPAASLMLPILMRPILAQVGPAQFQFVILESVLRVRYPNDMLHAVFYSLSLFFDKIAFEHKKIFHTN